MAAFLANEERDVIRFERGELSRWFGQRTRRALFIELAAETPSWPRNSLEWAIPTFLEEIQFQEGSDQVPIGALIDSLFDGDQYDPWEYVIDLVKDGLAARNLLERHLEQWFRLDTGRIEYRLPESTAQIASKNSPEEVQRLFSTTETAHPDIWELLKLEIDRAISARRTSYDGYNPYNYHSSI